MTKNDMMKFIQENAKKVTDSSLVDMIRYTQEQYSKDSKSIKLVDLRSLFKDVQNHLSSQKEQPAPANSIKKPVAKKKSSSSPKKDDTYKATDLAIEFPQEVEFNDSVIQKAEDIKTFNDFRNAFNKGENLFFAVYWTKRHLKQFKYCAIESIAQPEAFKDDLDIVQCIYVSDTDTVAFGVSLDTHAPYGFTPDDFEIVDNLRFSNGMEYEVYRLV